MLKPANVELIGVVWLGIACIASTSTAQAPAVGSACRLVTIDEAAAILGSRPETKEGKDQCNYVVPGESMQVVVGFQEYGRFPLEVALGRSRAHKSKDQEGYLIQDEPSLGKAAFSTRIPRSFTMWFGAKTVIVDIGIREDEGKNIPSALLDKLRDIAKKALNRI